MQCSEFDEEGEISYVTIDNELAAYQAVKHLIKLGNRRVALINTDEKYLYARERRRGYEKALHEFGLPIESKWMRETEQLGFEGGQQAMRSLLNEADKPNAVFSVSDVWMQRRLPFPSGYTPGEDAYQGS